MNKNGLTNNEAAVRAVSLTLYNTQRYRVCPECDRCFDMNLCGDIDEWSYGHDCEPQTVKDGAES